MINNSHYFMHFFIFIYSKFIRDTKQFIQNMVWTVVYFHLNGLFNIYIYIYIYIYITASSDSEDSISDSISDSDSPDDSPEDPTTDPSPSPTTAPSNSPTTMDCATVDDCLTAGCQEDDAACTDNPFCRFEEDACFVDCGNRNENDDVDTDEGGSCENDPLCEVISDDCFPDCGDDCLQMAVMLMLIDVMQHIIVHLIEI